MSGERVVVVKKQELSLTFGKRGAESRSKQFSRTEPKSICAELHGRALVVFLRRRIVLRSNVLTFEPFRGLEAPGGAAYEKDS